MAQTLLGSATALRSGEEQRVTDLDARPQVISQRKNGRDLVLEIVMWPSGKRSIRLGSGCSEHLYVSSAVEALLLSAALAVAAQDLE